ncbi:Phosphatase PHOSPHO-type [Dillenia turbinata]|uniref:Phosphatase PHOSPHO-type n=1 Tax=Dillenia turbinata TaxID=194707 RepID=A0AAN8W2I6_9MAGN
MADTVVVFDFDRTIIDGDSDRWVIEEMGLTRLFNQLRRTMPWTSLMDRMTMELHSRGKTISQIADCLKRVPLHPQIIATIRSAHAFGCDLKIISDANKFYIQTILENHGLLGCFMEIHTNPTFVDEEGRLRIIPYHDYATSPHGCSLCPTNMCKGLIIEQIRALAYASGKKRFIYLGDGSGDYCPSLKLQEGDHVMPRKDYPLWERIFSNPTLVKAKVHEWNGGEELARILLHLMNRISDDENISTGDAMWSSSCACEVETMQVPSPAQTLNGLKCQKCFNN